MKLLHKLSSGSGLVTFALALIIVFLAFLGVSYLLEKPPVVKDLKLTNISDSSVTVTYMTEEATVGSVIVSTTNNFDVLGQFSKAKFYDDRGDGVARKTHHVTIKGMLPEALYYFRISSGFKNADTTYPSIETASTPDTLRTPDPSYAKLTNQTNSDALVFFTLNNGTLQSTYLNSDSAFSIDKANIKTADLKGNITYKEGDEINVTVVDAGGSTRTLKTKVGEDQPINMQGFIDQTDGTSSTNLNKSLVSGVYAQACAVSEYPERYCQETKDGLCCKSAVRTIRKNADCSYSTTGDGMDGQSHDCNPKKPAEANKSTVTTDTNASNSGQSNEADKGCGSNRVVTYKKDLNCDTGKKIKVWVNEVCANGKITLQPGDATSEPCGELTTTQAGGLSKGGLTQTTQDAARKAEEAAKAKATPTDKDGKSQEGVLDPKALEANYANVCGTEKDNEIRESCFGGFIYTCKPNGRGTTGVIEKTTKVCGDAVKAAEVCKGAVKNPNGGAPVPVCGDDGFIYQCTSGGSGNITKEACSKVNKTDDLCKNVKNQNIPEKVTDPVTKKDYTCTKGIAYPQETTSNQYGGDSEACKAKSADYKSKIRCMSAGDKYYKVDAVDAFSVNYSDKSGKAVQAMCGDKWYSVDGTISYCGDGNTCEEGTGCTPKLVTSGEKGKTNGSSNVPVNKSGLESCTNNCPNSKKISGPGAVSGYSGGTKCTSDVNGSDYTCCVKDWTNALEGGYFCPSSEAPKKTGLLNNLVSPASAQSVLGTSDSTATEVKVDSTGKYKVTEVKGYEIVNSEAWVLDTGTASAGSLRFFEDKNRNSVKDEGEEYITTPLEVKVEKQSDVVKYEFVAGWNLISYNLAEGSTASKLISSINGFGGYATHVATYVAGSWMMYSERAGQKLGSDFKLVPGKGYFVKVIKPVTMYIEGKLVEKDQSIYLNTGWNLVGLRSTVTGAKNLIEEVNKTTVLNLDTVTRLEGGRYENLVSDGTTYYGNDFALKSEAGYFVRLKKGGASWKK